jgi:hypothetical protein
MKKLSSLTIIIIALTSTASSAKTVVPPQPLSQFEPSAKCEARQSACPDALRDTVRARALTTKGATATGISAQTWRIRGWLDDTDAQKYSVVVGSDQFTNAYRGDTDTSVALPILCISKQNLSTPAWHMVVTTPSSAFEGNFYEHTTPGGAARNTWSGARGFWSTPIAGAQLTSRATADGFCDQQAGMYGLTGVYRMAEFHDGDNSNGRLAGWGYWLDMSEANLLGLPMYPFPYTPTYTYEYDAVQRFWIAIDDQSSNPWN